MAEKPIGEVFKGGILSENPVFVLLLGMCPALAVTSSGWGGLGMGVATTFVLLGSSVTVSLIRSLIPKTVRIPAYIMVIATFVTVVDLLLNAYVHNLHKALGLFIPLIVVNCIVLGRAEAFASKQSVFRSAVDALGMGIGFTLALFILGACREFIATGIITIVDASGVLLKIAPFSADGIDGAVVMLLPPGAFIMLGILAGLRNVMNNKFSKRAKAAAETAACVAATPSDADGAAHYGEVTGVGVGEATVLINRRASCGAQANGSIACASCLGKKIAILVEDGIGARVGERVTVGLDDERKALPIAAMGYLMPACVIVVGALTGGIWGAVGGLSGALLVLAATAPALKKRGLWAKVQTVERNGEILSDKKSAPVFNPNEEDVSDKVKAAANI